MKPLNIHIKSIAAIILAVWILNFSIDPPDLVVLRTKAKVSVPLQEDTSINEIESIAELVLEEGLDLKNAIPEHKEPPGSEYDIFKKITSFLFMPSVHCFIWLEPVYVIRIKVPYSPFSCKDYALEITPPPPKA